jgi:hypothetical protein
VSRTDGVAYLCDAAATLAAFVDAFPPAAALLLSGGDRDGGGGVGGARDGALLAALAGVHDALAPELAALARRGTQPALCQQVWIQARS